jgi:hypothetical protein
MLCLSTLTDRAAVTVIHKTQARSSYPEPEDVWSVPFARSVERICFFRAFPPKPLENHQAALIPRPRRPPVGHPPHPQPWR